MKIFCVLLLFYFFKALLRHGVVSLSVRLLEPLACLSIILGDAPTKLIKPAQAPRSPNIAVGRRFLVPFACLIIILGNALTEFIKIPRPSWAAAAAALFWSAAFSHHLRASSKSRGVPIPS